MKDNETINESKRKSLVFLSYNSADKKVAEEIAVFLATAQVGVWFDEWALAPGDSLIEEIDGALGRCSHYVLVWSRRAARSRWVQRELRSTLARVTSRRRRPIKIIPVCVDKTPLPNICSDLSYLTHQNNMEIDYSQIINAVTGATPEIPFIKILLRKIEEVMTDISNLAWGTGELIDAETGQGWHSNIKCLLTSYNFGNFTYETSLGVADHKHVFVDGKPYERRTKFWRMICRPANCSCGYSIVEEDLELIH